LTVFHHQAVVVVGAMNPAIHHPAWYHAMSIISDSEFEESKRKPIVTTPPLAQFESSGFSVVCLPDRWQASCQTPDATRIVALAQATFGKLYHTPVKAYGVNHDFHAETAKMIPSTLATIVRQTGLPFPPNEVATAAITYEADVDGCKFTTVISGSPKGSLYLYVKNNAHFALVPQASLDVFDLGPLLDKAFRRNEDRAQSMLSDFINAIQGLQ
jgi:hypothetical protein